MNRVDVNGESTDVEAIKRQLDSNNVELQRKGGVSLEKLAEHRPEVLLQNLSVVEAAFDSDDVRTIEGALRATSKVVSVNPSESSVFVPLIADSLSEVQSTNTQLSGVRALALLATNENVDLSAYDGELAKLLRDGDLLIREKVAQNFSPIVGDRSSEYPQLVETYIDALSDPRKNVQESALVTIALIAANAPEEVDPWSVVLDRVDSLDPNDFSDSKRITEAKEIIRSVAAQWLDRGDE